MNIKNIFKTKEGDVVIFQKPNWVLYVVLGFLLVGYIDLFKAIGYWGVTIFLVYWSYLEITEGVNYFRRILGVVAILYLLVTRLQIFI